VSTIEIVCCKLLTPVHKPVACHTRVSVPASPHDGVNWSENMTELSVPLVLHDETLNIATPVTAGSVLLPHSIMALAFTKCNPTGPAELTMICVPEIDRPHASLAVMRLVIVTVPHANDVASEKLRDGDGSHASVAEKLPILCGDVSALHGTLTGDEIDKEGGSKSTTEIRCVRTIELPH